MTPPFDQNFGFFTKNSNFTVSDSTKSTQYHYDFFGKRRKYPASIVRDLEGNRNKSAIFGDELLNNINKDPDSTYKGTSYKGRMCN